MIDPWKDFTFLFRIAKHQLNAVSISFASLRSVSYNVSLVDAADVAICDAEPCGVGGFPTTTPLKPGLTSSGKGVLPISRDQGLQYSTQTIRL